MTCPHCGAAAAERARFCAACGRELDLDPTVAASDQATRIAPPKPGGATPASGWLTSSDSISHGRFAPGVVLDGRYRIIGLLGRGGMGEVYRADDLRLGQPVALKFLPDDVGSDAARLAQFHNEVRSARHVAHPNICRVYDISETDGHLFLSMELVDGEDLAASLRRIGRFPEDKALDIARQLCAGLAAAHERNVLHRDLKPANVMLDADGKVRLMDFGLATVGAEDRLRAGTPGYMAPEQLRGGEATARSDIYALGLVLYELFSGRRPFNATSIAGLIEQQESGTLTPPSTIVTALDPSIERAILRCLDPDPARRPSSPLAVSAALPGGDPLAAALAAGETPSPEMVAASGKGAGLARGWAAAILAATLAAAVATYFLPLRASVLHHMRPELSADVLAQKAREILRTLGYTDRPRDEAYEFFWDTELTGHIAERDTAPVNWARIATVRPSPLAFWYRRADEPMIAESFHHDLLTPGIVTQADPAPIRSGMMSVQLDHFGWLTAFEAIPPQEETKAVTPAAIDWAAVFKLAGLDPATLTPATPQRNWLSNPDARAAWTGIWPDSNRPLRIEAGTRGGQLTAFRVLGPWNAPERSASPSDSEGIVFITVLFILVLAIIVGGGLLARKNLREGRGDRTSAFRLACLVSAALWLLWICQGHFPATPGMIGIFLLAVCTTVSYSVLFWAVYLALEPFVRRHWPQTLVSWTTLLSGRLRDPIVGRDVLIGAAIGVATAVFIRIAERFSGQPVLVDNEVLTGLRAAAGAVVSVAIYSVRSALLVFYLLFLLRVVLRNQWIAAVALVFLFTALNFFEPGEPVVKALVTLVYFSLLAVAVLRWGLTSLAVALLTANLLMTAPVTTDRSAWFIVSAAAIGALPLALATWAFFVSAPGASRARRAGMFDA